jgi:hypothetical protein
MFSGCLIGNIKKLIFDKMEETAKKIEIFWTGGWDSTFRLIQVLMTTSAQVRPHYLIRAEKSTGIEIYVMILIRRAILTKYPEVRKRFLSTVYFNADQIEISEDIEKEILRLRKASQINEQYRLMLHYCKQFNIEQIEVSLDKSPNETPEEWLIKHFQDSPIFNCFTYPIFNLTKSETHEIVKEHKWEDIMFMTSFCRRPKVVIEPCGQCGSCVDTVEAGMGFRFPVYKRIKAKLQIPIRAYWRKNYVNQDKGKFLKYIKQRFESKL